MKKFRNLLLIFGLLSVFLSCKKEDIDVNQLGGETNIALTEVGNITDVYVNIGSLYVPGTIEVTSRDNGLVTYHAILDYSSLPEADLLDDLIDDAYQEGPGKLKADFNMKITSEGYQDFFLQGGKPWIAFRYDDPVGTRYTATQSDGSVLTRTVTEKTGVDDFFWNGLLIKTIKVEQDFPAGDSIAKKLTIRGNHRFGLVYAELQLNNNDKVKITLDPNFPL